MEVRPVARRRRLVGFSRGLEEEGFEAARMAAFVRMAGKKKKK